MVKNTYFQLNSPTFRANEYYLRVNLSKKMNRKAAFQILNLQEGANQQTIQQQYQNLYNKFQTKITNAPNAALKTKFEQNFALVEQAYQVLQQEVSNDAWLPSSEPVQVVQKQGDKSVLKENGEVQPAQPASSKSPQKEKSISKIPILVAIFAVSAAVLFAVLWWQSRGEVARLLPLEEELTNYKEKFQNRPFGIKNMGNEPFMVSYYRLYYVSEDGNIKWEEGQPNVKVEPGRDFSNVMKVEKSEVVFDGKALFYTFVLTPLRPGYPYYDSGVIESDEPVLVNPVFE